MFRKKKERKQLSSDNEKPPTEVLSQQEIDQLLMAINVGNDDDEDDDVQAADEAVTRFKSRFKKAKGQRSFKPAPNHRIKIYDFTRPSLFSRDNMRKLQDIHEKLEQIVSPQFLIKEREWHIDSIDQLTNEEFMRSLPTPGTIIIVFEYEEKDFYCQIDGSLCIQIIDNLISKENFEHSEKQLTKIETAIVEKYIAESLLEGFRQTFTFLDHPENIAIKKIDNDPRHINYTQSDVGCLITNKIDCGEDSNVIAIHIPYDTIRKYIKKVTQNEIVENIKNQDLQPVLDNVQVEVKAEFFREKMTLKEVCEFKSNYTFYLPNRGDSVNLVVDDTEFATGHIELTPNQTIVIQVSKLESKKLFTVKERNRMKIDENLENVEIIVSAELGRTTKTLGELKSLGDGSIIELNTNAGEPVSIFVNNVLYAEGEVVVTGERFGIRLLEVFDEDKKQQLF